jgi:hypothetical protein
MRTIAIMFAMCSPASAALLWEIEMGGSFIGSGPGSEHPVRLTFSTNDIGPFHWERQVSLATVGQAVEVDAATVDSFDQLTKPGNISFSIEILTASDSGGNKHIETTSANPLVDAFTTIRHVPLLVTNLFGYDLTGISHTG